MFCSTKAAVITLSVCSLAIAGPVEFDSTAPKSVTVEARQASDGNASLLPSVNKALTFDKYDPTLEDLVHEFEEVTGSIVMKTARACEQAANTRLRLPENLIVPESEAYAFFESVLLRHDYVLIFMKGGAVPMFAIQSNGNHSALYGNAMELTPEQVLSIGDHPGLLVETTVSLQHVDVRAATTALRGLVMSQTSAVLPIGQRSIYLRGTHSFVRSAVKLLREADENTDPPEPAQKPGGQR